MTPPPSVLYICIAAVLLKDTVLLQAAFVSEGFSYKNGPGGMGKVAGYDGQYLCTLKSVKDSNIIKKGICLPRTGQFAGQTDCSAVCKDLTMGGRKWMYYPELPNSELDEPSPPCKPRESYTYCCCVTPA